MNVRLRSASLIPATQPWTWHSAEFEMEVENLAFEKEIAVHFKDGHELPAHYSGSLGNGRELWSLRVPEQDGPDELGRDIILGRAELGSNSKGRLSGSKAIGRLRHASACHSPIP